MKKIFALLLVAIMLLGMLSGCGKKNSQDDASGETTEAPAAVGTLLVNVNAAVLLSYDADGLVLNVAGADDNGASLAAEYKDFFGKTCAEAASDLLSASRITGFLDMETTYMLVKQEANSALPSGTFLESVKQSLTEALTGAGYQSTVVLLTSDDLDKNGNISLASAETLMLAYTAMDHFDSIDGTAEPIDGVYSFRVTVDTTELDLLVDATTGSVSHGTLDDVEIGDPMIDTETDIDPEEETSESAPGNTETDIPEETTSEEA